jgi:hypothetical protein
MKANKGLGAYGNGESSCTKSANILNYLNINKNLTQEILRSPRAQQNLDGPTLKIFKDHNTLLIIACKKMGVERKLNKKCKRSSIDCSFALAFAFFNL